MKIVVFVDLKNEQERNKGKDEINLDLMQDY